VRGSAGGGGRVHACMQLSYEFAPHFGVYIEHDRAGQYGEAVRVLLVEPLSQSVIDGLFWPYGNLPLIILNEVCERLL
jgi:hypothetical protein